MAERGRPSRRTWIEISRSALLQNLSSLQRHVGGTVKIAPVIKANAYGHGMALTAKTLPKSQIWGFGVAYGEEALAVRQEFDGPILAMSYWQANELDDAIRQSIDLVAWDRQSLTALAAAGRRLNRRVRVHLKLDVGTTRIGFRHHDAAWLHDRVRQARSWQLSGVFAHFAQSEARDHAVTDAQRQSFDQWSRTLIQTRTIRHIACTASALRYPEARFDLVRIGIGLYGLWPSDPIRQWMNVAAPTFRLRPVMTWKSRLMQVKKVPRGTGIGYGHSFVTKRPTTVGVVPVGYSEGYDRKFSNRGWMMVGKRPAPVIGRVSMNLTMVDLTGHRSVRRGSEVTLLGPGVNAAELASLVDRIDYEMTSRIHPMIPRVLRP